MFLTFLLAGLQDSKKVTDGIKYGKYLRWDSLTLKITVLRPETVSLKHSQK